MLNLRTISRPLYSHHQDGRFVGAVTIDVPNADQAVPIELKAGDVSIYHTRTPRLWPKYI